mgnify:FL=1
MAKKIQASLQRMKWWAAHGPQWSIFGPLLLQTPDCWAVYGPNWSNFGPRYKPLLVLGPPVAQDGPLTGQVSEGVPASGPFLGQIDPYPGQKIVAEIQKTNVVYKFIGPYPRPSKTVCA